MPIVSVCIDGRVEMLRRAPSRCCLFDKPDVRVSPWSLAHDGAVRFEKEPCAVRRYARFAVLILARERRDFGRHPFAVSEMRNDDGSAAEIDVVFGEIDRVSVRSEGDVIVEVFGRDHALAKDSRFCDRRVGRVWMFEPLMRRAERDRSNQRGNYRNSKSFDVHSCQPPSCTWLGVYGL